MKVRWLAPLAGMILCCGLLSPAAADTFRYEFPENLVLALEKAPAKLGRPGTTLVGTLESRLGVLKQLRIFFESSPDLRVVPATMELKELSAGSLRRFKVRLEPGAGSPDASGSWVRLRVMYRPDYVAIATHITSSSAFSDPMERRRLLETLRRNSTARKTYTSAVRWFAGRSQQESAQ